MYQFINAACFTNLDSYDCSLVKKFYQIPNIRDRVEVWYKGNRSTLRVIQITHGVDYDNNPRIRVELHN